MLINATDSRKSGASYVGLLLLCKTHYNDKKLKQEQGMENTLLKNFIDESVKQQTKITLVLSGAIITGKVIRFDPFFDLLELESCFSYTGGSIVSVENLIISPDKSVLSWGYGETKNIK